MDQNIQPYLSSYFESSGDPHIPICPAMQLRLLQDLLRCAIGRDCFVIADYGSTGSSFESVGNVPVEASPARQKGTMRSLIYELKSVALGCHWIRSEQWAGMSPEGCGGYGVDDRGIGCVASRYRGKVRRRNAAAEGRADGRIELDVSVSLAQCNEF